MRYLVPVFARLAQHAPFAERCDTIKFRFAAMLAQCELKAKGSSPQVFDIFSIEGKDFII